MGLGDIGGNLGGNLSMDQLQPLLQGVNFPAGKDEVASQAEGNGAPQDMVSQIKNSATERFNNPQEVLDTVQGGK